MNNRTNRVSGVRKTTDREGRRLVVLAEDDEGIQWALNEALTEAGCEVIAVATVHALREVLGARTPDVLVADYQLLDDTTEVIVTEIVETSAVASVVVVSAAPAARTLAERLAIPHISKPFELDEVIAAVAHARTSAA